MPNFSKIVTDIVNQGFSQTLAQERQAELDKIGKSWDFYYGDQEKYIAKYRGESQEDYDDKDKMVFNYTRSVIDEYLNGVFAKPVSIVYKDKKYQKTWDEMTDPITFFKIVLFLKKVQRIAELSKLCLVMLRWNNETKSVYFEDIRGEFVNFIPDEKNPKEIGAVVISYVYDTGDPDINRRFLKRIEIWDKNKWEIWLHSPALREEKKVSSGKNPYGFIPGIRFVPEEDDNTHYGLSSTEDIVKVNEVYNNLWTSLVRICIMQSFSVLVVKSDGNIELTIAPTRFLKLENVDDADASYITPSPKISDVEKVLLDLKNELQDFSKVPSEVLQASKAKYPSSGYALRIKRIPIEQVWESRRMSYGPSLKDLSRKAIVVDKVHRNESPPNFKDIKVQVGFTNTIPAYSPQEQMIIDQSDLRYNLITPVDLMIRKYPHLTQEEAKAKIKENKKVTEELLGEPGQNLPNPQDENKNIKGLMNNPDMNVYAYQKKNKKIPNEQKKVAYRKGQSDKENPE